LGMLGGKPIEWAMLVPKSHCAMQCFHGKRTSDALCAIILGCKYQINAEPIEGV